MIKKLICIASVLFVMSSKAQIINTVAGDTIGYSTFMWQGGYSGDGGNATAAQLSNPDGIALDAVGNLYIADTYNNRIRKVTTAGIISTFAGNGTGGYSGDGGQSTDAELYYPKGVAVDAAGNLYIADYGNQRIRKVSTTGIIATIAGNGTSGYTGDGGNATAAQLSNPDGIALDAVGNLYIADTYNNRIRKVTTVGIISTFAGNGTGGYSGDGGNATAAELYFPYGVALDAAGNVYIADGGNSRIRKVSTTGIIATIAGNGTSGYTGDGGNATTAELNYPNGVAVDAAGNIYIADYHNQRIRMVNTLGIITTIVGNGTAGYAGDGGTATDAELTEPSGVALDAVGNLYIADDNNNVIRKVSFCNIIPTVTYTLTADIAPHTWDAYPTYSPNVVSARWYWGDGKDTVALYPSHTYSVAGTYSICVAAYSACGDSAVSCQNDAVSRSGNNSPYSNMVYINVLNGNQTTGIQQITSSNEVSLYPNPATSSLQVTFSGNIQNTTIEVYNTIGECVHRQIATSSNSQIDVFNLAEGIYNISISSNEGVVNKRVVIVH